ncbi:ATP-binding cassette domain-containing protein [Streptomyces sp. NPDC001834]|uniref:ATP-binding cassette domain-containing protein n=1 Tax=Streptomyces sp. NPDC001834 TaxID=3364616 RepID=UPI003695D830
MIRAHALTKRYRGTVVQDLDSRVRPGAVTGFLGPNGAGKSTTTRVLLGMDAPTRGRSTIGGRAYTAHAAPLTEVGALLEARSVHPGRTAFHHLMALAHTLGVPRARVEHVLDLTGLSAVAHRRVKGFSLGMGQRLGIAAAPLGDPAVLLLDELVNGLDPEGVLWIRDLLRSPAREGRTVLVSSHLMSETALTADHLVVIGRGRLLADTSVADFVSSAGGASVRVVTPQAHALRKALTTPGIDIALSTKPGTSPDELEIRSADARHIGRIAAAHAIPLCELTPRTASLEQAFMELTRGSVEYRTATPEPTAPPQLTRP